MDDPYASYYVPDGGWINIYLMEDPISPRRLHYSTNLGRLYMPPTREHGHGSLSRYGVNPKMDFTEAADGELCDAAFSPQDFADIATRQCVLLFLVFLNGRLTWGKYANDWHDGLIFVPARDIKSRIGGDFDKAKVIAKTRLQREVLDFAAFLKGEVFGYKLFSEDAQEIKHGHSFYGMDWHYNGIAAHAGVDFTKLTVRR